MDRWGEGAVLRLVCPAPLSCTPGTLHRVPKRDITHHPPFTFLVEPLNPAVRARPPEGRLSRFDVELLSEVRDPPIRLPRAIVVAELSEGSRLSVLAGNPSHVDVQRRGDPVPRSRRPTARS